MTSPKATMTFDEVLKLRWNRLVTKIAGQCGATGIKIEWDEMEYLRSEGWSPRDAAAWQVGMIALEAKGWMVDRQRHG